MTRNAARARKVGAPAKTVRTTTTREEEIGASSPLGGETLVMPGDGGLGDEGEEMSSAEKLLEDLDFSNVISIKLHRQPGKGNQAMQFLCMFTPDEFVGDSGLLLQRIQDDFGEGNYRLQFRSGSNSLVRNRFVSIGPKPASARAVVAGAPGVDPSGMANLVAALAESIRSGFESMAERLAPPVNPAAQLRETLAIVKEILPPPVAPAPAPAASPNNPMEVMKDMLDIHDTLDGWRPRQGGRAGFMDLAVEMFRAVASGRVNLAAIGNTIQSAVMSAQAARAGAAPPGAQPAAAAASPQPAVTAAPAASPNPAVPADAQPPVAIPAELQVLVNAALMNVPPENFVELVLNLLPGDDRQAEQELRALDLAAVLERAQPELASKREWFERLKALALEDLTNPRDGGQTE